MRDARRKREGAKQRERSVSVLASEINTFHASLRVKFPEFCYQTLQIIVALSSETSKLEEQQF